jgi:ADP-ribose pyrophosphatase
MTVYEDQVIKETYLNGATGTFNRIEVRDSVIVIPIFKDGSVVMVETYRHGVGTGLLELPGGLIDEGEAARGSAERELIEETGYSCDKMKMINWFYTCPGRTGQRNFVFLATDLLAHSNRKLDQLEQIKVHKLSRNDVAKELKIRGRIKSCLTVAALHEAYL